MTLTASERDYRINSLRGKVANAICTKKISADMAYNAMIDMKFFESWEDDELYYRPVNESEIAECVYDYWAEKMPEPKVTLEDIYPFLFTATTAKGKEVM